jgi:Uma2 family endonuclease
MNPATSNAATSLSPPAAFGLPVHTFTVDEYHELIASGALGSEDRVELLEGVVVDIPRIGPGHAVSVEKTVRSLSQLELSGWHLRAQQPVALERSAPQPDLAIVRGGQDDYASRHPGPSEIGLVIEIAETTVDVDRNRKAQIYADAAIPEYWLINLPERKVEVFSEPQAKKATRAAYFRRVTVVAEDGTLELRLAGKVMGVVEAAGLFVKSPG